MNRRQLLQILPAAAGIDLRQVTNVYPFEEEARRKLPAPLFAEIAGTERAAFDRITLRPRLMIDALRLDLSSELFGTPLFAPILVAPIARQERFHPDGEVATAKGASAGKAVMVIPSDASKPLQEIAAACNGPFWLQVAPGPDPQVIRTRVDEAEALGCKALVLTLGVPGAQWDWAAIDKFRAGLRLPLILKGIITPEEARSAMFHGAQGIIVSAWRGTTQEGILSPLDALPLIATAIAGRVPLLVDGNFRRGTDVIKALGFGAKAVLVGRPVTWGLTTHGAGGVQTIMELMQTELARVMAMCGRRNLREIDRSVLRIHKR